MCVFKLKVRVTLIPCYERLSASFGTFWTLASQPKTVLLNKSNLNNQVSQWPTAAYLISAADTADRTAPHIC